jgi:hypothetical protein
MWPVLNGCSGRPGGGELCDRNTRFGAAILRQLRHRPASIESLWDDANVDSRTDFPALLAHSTLAGRATTIVGVAAEVVSLLRRSWPALCREPSSSHRPEGRQRMLKLISTRRNDCRPRHVHTTQTCRPAAWQWDSSGNERSG